MKKLFLSFILMWIVTLIVSCSTDLSETLEYSSLVGSVSDQTTGEPIPTANVSLLPGGKSTVTGSDGAFAFQDLDPGTYSLLIKKEGYNSTSIEVEVHSGNPTSVHLTLERIPSAITADKSELDFGETLSTLSFTIVNSGYSDLTYTVEKGDCDWITVDPQEDILKYGKTATIVVNVDRKKLPDGYNEANIIVRSTSGNGNAEVKVIAINNANASVNTLDVTNIKNNSATLNGEITNPGKPSYTERGFIVGDHPSPSFDDYINKISAPVNSNSLFSVNITNLSPVKTYYVRAYMIQNGNIVYGNIVAFSTSMQETEVSTSGVTDISATTALLNGSILNEGNPVYTEKGFCYDKINNPTIANNRRVVSGGGSGAFSLQITNLEFPQNYYVRAYAIQDGKTIYGNTVSFSTNYIETSVRTSAATQITDNSAVLNGSIVNAGSPSYTEKGFCYKTGWGEPSLNDIKIVVSGSGNGDFQTSIKNLTYNTNYIFRAYAIQNGKTIYGDILSFGTSYDEAIVSTSSVTNIGYTSATFNGNIGSIGSPAITERGFCYSPSYDWPSINDNRVKVNGISLGDFKYEAQNLEENQKYFVRAYVIQNGEVIYGSRSSFTTYYQPIVATGPWISQSSGITIQGAFADGNPGVSEFGFVYSNTSNPTVTSGTKIQGQNLQKKEDGAYYYKRTLTGLQSYRTYYYRAYVKTSIGYTYGETESFTTY